MFVTESLLKDFVGAVIALLVITVGYYKWAFQYWKRRNVPYLEPRFPFGNLPSPLDRKSGIAVTFRRLYDEMKRNGWKHGGIYFFSGSVYYVVDLNYIKNILTKDFQYFTDRGAYYNEKDDPLSAHLFALGGTKWRNLRTKLTPTFTSGKMKMMFQTVVDCKSGLLERIEQGSASKEAIDIKDVLSCFTTDVIGSCAFGLECHSFKEDNSPFRIYSNKFFNGSNFVLLKTLMSVTFPNIAKALSITVLPKDVAAFFTQLVKDTVNYRETNNVQRKDFMQLLIDLKNNKLAQGEGYKHDGNTLSIEEIAAQSVLFFLAGFETSSTTMTLALYELAKHQKIQDKLRNEINTILHKHGDKMTYEAIQEMKYMDQVVDETLRKYPPVPFITRKAEKDYEVAEEGLIIEKGTFVVVPIYGIHYDEEYYPDPEKFDPERFNEENKSSRHRYAFIPFGEGPRICIGMRFGLMQTKVGLAALLQKYNFVVNRKTQEPLMIKPGSGLLSVEGGVWLTAEKL